MSFVLSLDFSRAPLLDGRKYSVFGHAKRAKVLKDFYKNVIIPRSIFLTVLSDERSAVKNSPSYEKRKRKLYGHTTPLAQNTRRIDAGMRSGQIFEFKTYNQRRVKGKTGMSIKIRRDFLTNRGVDIMKVIRNGRVRSVDINGVTMGYRASVNFIKNTEFRKRFKFGVEKTKGWNLLQIPDRQRQGLVAILSSMTNEAFVKAYDAAAKSAEKKQNRILRNQSLYHVN